jgi:hypothetical protein
LPACQLASFERADLVADAVADGGVDGCIWR